MTDQPEPAPRRRWVANRYAVRRWRRIGLVLALAWAACARPSSPPDWADAAAIANALNNGGIECVFTDTSVTEPSTAKSTGRCEGDDFTLQITVFETAEARERAEQDAQAYVCDLGIDKPTTVRGDRWLVGDVEPTLGPTTFYAEDLAEATDGDLDPTCD